jgi:predicted small lipoprotein YifL
MRFPQTVILNVKSILDLTRAGAVLSAITLVSLFGLTACGQKGPLYLPKPVPIATTPSKAPAPPASQVQPEQDKRSPDSPATPASK